MFFLFFIFKLIFLTLVIISDYQSGDPPLNEPFLGCTNTTNVLKFDISKCPMTNLSSGNYIFPSCVQSLYFCVFFCQMIKVLQYNNPQSASVFLPPPEVCLISCYCPLIVCCSPNSTVLVGPIKRGGDYLRPQCSPFGNMSSFESRSQKSKCAQSQHRSLEQVAAKV